MPLTEPTETRRRRVLVVTATPIRYGRSEPRVSKEQVLRYPERRINHGHVADSWPTGRGTMS